MYEYQTTFLASERRRELQAEAKRFRLVRATPQRPATTTDRARKPRRTLRISLDALLSRA